ncbi:MAG TPA: ATP-binding cassette domain-containing protein [Verrucomicrobiae bacterium]|nr:ATP-binding cassette domain-containing protein [Verrucomicrobiae bacterium]
MTKPTADKTSLLTLDGIAVRHDMRTVFARTSWTWRRGEQWAMLGSNGSGKSLLTLALCGRVPLLRGEIHYHFDAAAGDALPEQSIALLSPQIQRELATGEGSFYQSRWHSGIGEGRRTVAQFLSQASVEDINPFEVGARRGNSRAFAENRRRFIRWLGIEPLLQRKLISLSNGEQRKVLLVHTLLRSPQLLILDDPFGGLDVATRARLKTVIRRLMRAGLPVLVITSRPDELPAQTTHLLLVRHHRVVAQGTKRAMLRHPLARALSRSQSLPFAPSIPPPKKHAAINRAVSLVEFNHVTVRFGRQRILDDVTWMMRRGEHWALLGPNGSGKTTLLSLIQGDNPQAYALDLRLLGRKPESTQTLWQLRRQIGWLSPELHLHYPPGWSCLDVVCSGFTSAIGLYEPCTARQRAAARGWLRRFGLAGRADDSFGELSLGDQRLVLLARAAVKKPRLLVLDEPCQGLDAAHRHSMLATVDQLIAQTRAGLIFVTHHAGEMPACITHVLKLKSGRVRQTSRR